MGWCGQKSVDKDMKIKINDTKYFIPPISSLNFNEFNDIIIKNEITNLKEYISLLVDIPIDELMSAKISEGSSELLHNTLFDVQIDKAIKDVRSTIVYEDNVFIVNDMSLDTFGKVYLFDLIYSKYASKEINIYELSIKTLSLFMANSHDMEEVDRISLYLSRQNWLKILPTAFFLTKKLLKKKKGLRIILIQCMLELKRIRLLSSFRIMKYRTILKS